MLYWYPSDSFLAHLAQIAMTDCLWAWLICSGFIGGQCRMHWNDGSHSTFPGCSSLFGWKYPRDIKRVLFAAVVTVPCSDAVQRSVLLLCTYLFVYLIPTLLAPVCSMSIYIHPSVCPSVCPSVHPLWSFRPLFTQFCLRTFVMIPFIKMGSQK